MTTTGASLPEHWPSLPLEAWSDTYATLHMWTQIVGKIRLAQSPWVNHSWHVTLYVTATRAHHVADPVRRPHVPDRFRLRRSSADDPIERRRQPRSAARAPVGGGVLRAPHGGAGASSICASASPGSPTRSPTPSASIRTRLTGRTTRSTPTDSGASSCRPTGCSSSSALASSASAAPCTSSGAPPDLAVTRFSGRRAPEHPGGIPNLPDWVAREAYSHEVSSCGFWPGGGAIPYPAFYSYAYPEPTGFPDVPVKPDGAFYSRRASASSFCRTIASGSRTSPDETLLEFLQTTYEAAATLARWDRSELERNHFPERAV